MVEPEPLRTFGHAVVSQRDEPASLILDLLEGRDAVRADPLQISRSKSEMTSAEFFHSIEAICFEHTIDLTGTRRERRDPDRGDARDPRGESVDGFGAVGARHQTHARVRGAKVEDAQERQPAESQCARLIILRMAYRVHSGYEHLMTNPELRAALIAAFSPLPITRATIHTADARWADYEERDALPLIEGKSWVELAPEVLEHHAALLVHAGGALYRAILPAYLLLLAENEYSTALPFHVATQLARKDSSVDREIFDERVGPMTAEQRDVVRRAIAIIARQALLREAVSVAIRSW